MDMGFLTEYCVPVILAACLVVSYCIRRIRWLSRLSDQYIPALMAVLGLFLSSPVTLGSGGAITVQSLVGGAVTGLASTGMRQIFEIFIEKKEANHETKGQDS